MHKSTFTLHAAQVLGFFCLCEIRYLLSTSAPFPAIIEKLQVCWNGSVMNAHSGCVNNFSSGVIQLGGSSDILNRVPSSIGAPLACSIRTEQSSSLPQRSSTLQSFQPLSWSGNDVLTRSNSHNQPVAWSLLGTSWGQPAGGPWRPGGRRASSRPGTHTRIPPPSSPPSPSRLPSACTGARCHGQTRRRTGQESQDCARH